MLRKLIMATPLLGGYCTVLAQIDAPRYEIGVNIGTFVYQGDLTPAALGSFKTMRPAIGISAARVLNPYFSVRANLAFGKLAGDDARYASPEWRRQRNFNFHSSVTELSAQVVWNIFGNNGNTERRVISPYLFGGAGYSFLNIKRDWSKMNTSFYDAESTVQAGLNADSAHGLPRGMPVFPVGMGLRYPVTSSLSLSAEAAYRFSFSDYLDGFSKSGNPVRKDHYTSYSIGVIYSLGRRNRMACPVIRY